MKPKNTPLRIGTYVSSLRRQTKLSQSEVALALGVDRNTYAKWETGYRDIKAEYLPAIAELFGVSISDLFQGDKGKTGSTEATGVIIILSEKEMIDQILDEIKMKCRLAQIEIVTAKR